MNQATKIFEAARGAAKILGTSAYQVAWIVKDLYPNKISKGNGYCTYEDGSQLIFMHSQEIVGATKDD